MDFQETQALCAAAAQGDSAAVSRLLEAYMPDLHAYVRLRTRGILAGRESSSDIVQSVCREVLEHADRFRHPGEAAFRHWLFTTAHRKLADRVDHWRAQKRDAGREERADALGDAVGEQLAARYSTFCSVSGRAILKEEVERIESAFARMPEDYREVILLAHFVGLSRREIAEQMGRSEAAVRVLLHRAMARAARLLGTEEAAGPEP